MRRAAVDLGFQDKLAAVVDDSDTTEDDADTDADSRDTTSRDEGGVTPTPDEDNEVVDVSSEPSTGATSRNLFQHPEVHPVVLDLVLLQKYGPEWMTWEPETLRLRVAHDFGQEIGDMSMHKIHAMKTLHFVDTYWESWEVFCWVTMAFNGVPPDFNVMQVPTVAQCAVSVDTANRVRSDVSFSLELNDYIEQVHMHDGTFVPIEPLEFVTMDDVEDYPVDIEEIETLWPVVRTSGKPPTADTVTSEQLRRMLGIREYVEEHRTRLKEQLSLVRHV